MREIPPDLVSLGTFNPMIPESWLSLPTRDTLVFNVVDISIEPHDGDPSHSGTFHLARRAHLVLTEIIGSSRFID